MNTERGTGAAVRVFAAEFAGSVLPWPGSGRDEPVTRSGAWCGRMYIAGALTGTSGRGDGISARVADPTGTFELRVPARQDVLVSALAGIEPPQWVAVTGSGQAGRAGNPWIRPGDVRVTDRSVRDSWVITTAAATLARLRAMEAVLRGTGSDPVLAAVAENLAVTERDLVVIARIAEGALSSARPVTGIPVRAPDVRETLLSLIRENSGPKGIPVADLVGLAGASGIGVDAVMDGLRILVQEDEIYQPAAGTVRIL